jgi:hypothetical protein
MVRVAVVVPVGPNCRVEFVRDTLDSIDYFVDGRTLIVMDDSGSGTAAKAVGVREATVLPASTSGLRGGLYGSLAAGFNAALASDFEILLRIDTDGLVAGADFAEDASRIFSSETKTGALGSYTTGYDGGRRSFTSPRNRLAWELTVGVFRDTRLALRLWSLFLRAIRRGYVPGEHVMGGVVVYSHAAVKALKEAGALDDHVVARSKLQEDHLFGLYLRSLGFTLANFGQRGDSLPMGVKHRGLPAAPDELIAGGKSLIHSTKFFGDMDEAGIRASFAAARSRL